jgi:hypothetical protein
MILPGIGLSPCYHIRLTIFTDELSPPPAAKGSRVAVGENAARQTAFAAMAQRRTREKGDYVQRRRPRIGAQP